MKILFSFLFVITCVVSYAQINLVPNPSFEEYDTCPTFLSQLYRATGWSINVNSADYFNICASPGSFVSVPTAFGFQYPRTGNAYAGFSAKRMDISFVEDREYLGRELLSPLIPGTEYYVSFYVSLNYLICGVDKIGMLFTNNFLGDTVILPAPLINNFAHVYTDSIISDTVSWTKISGSFIADSAYRYFMIGLFFDDFHIDSLYIPDSVYTVCANYYYVDDVCVSSDATVCDLTNGTNSDQNNRTINVYPNPATDFLNISLSSQFSELTIYDVMGKEYYRAVERDEQVNINTSDFLDGIYFLRAKTKNSLTTIKFLIKK